MLNLLPTETKKKLSRLYYSRIIIMVMWFGFAVFIIAICLLIPLYIVVQAEQNSLDKELVQLKTQSEFQIEEILREDISEINKKLTAFSIDKKSLLSQDALSPILDELSSGVEITEFFYSSKFETPLSIEITGIAKGRDDLQSFADRLEKNIAFSKIELPISEFVKNKDVTFRISAFLKQE